MAFNVKKVGVDEGEVVRRLAAVGDQRVEGVGGRGDPQVDPVGHAGVGPRAACHCVHSSETSQQTSEPSSGSASATTSDE